MHRAHPFKTRRLALAVMALLAPGASAVMAEPFIFQPTLIPGPAAPAFDGSLTNPAVAQAYVGEATPEKLAAALAGLRPLLAELPLIAPPEPCWYCGSGGVIITGPGYNNPIDVIQFGPEPTLLTATSDADLGAPGAAVTLAFARLRLEGSFETGRDFVIGSPDYGPTYVPSGNTWTGTVGNPGQIDVGYILSPSPIEFHLVESDPLPLPELFFLESGPLPLPDPPLPVAQAVEPTPGGPGWIDTNGHDLRIAGVVTSHQKLWKEGEGTLWLTGANVWHAVPEVKAGVLKGDAASLATDIVNAGLVSFAQAADATYAHVVSGTGGVEKTGAGRLALTRAQTYKGATDIKEGTLALGYRGQLPDQTLLTIAPNATLDISGAEYGAHIAGLAGDGNVALGEKRLTITVTGEETQTFAGAISGQGKVIINYGKGAQRLTGDNTYAGGTELLGWTARLEIVGDANLGAPDTAVRLSDGTLAVLAPWTTRRTIVVNGGGALDSNGHDITLLSGLQGTGGFTKKGQGTLFITTATPFSGVVEVAAGTLALMGAGALNPASHVNVDAAVLDLGGADGDRQLRSVTGYDSAELRLGTNTLTLADGQGTFNGVISGLGGLTLDGADTHQTLTGANTYTGATTILAGSLRARPQSLSGQVVNHGRLELFDYGKLDSISAYSGDISGSGQLIKTDESVIWLRGHNTYSGGTLVEKGVLMGNTDSLPGDVETQAGLAFYQVADGTYMGRVSGTGTLMSFGPGALTLTGDNTHTGGTAFSNTLRVSRDANLGGPQSGLLIAGGTLVALDDLNLNRHVALGEAGARFDSNGFDITLNGLIDGPGGVTKLGEGVLYLAGEQGYAGTTRVERGGLLINGSFAGDVEVLDGGWFQAKGRIGGDLTVAKGASLSAGNSPGFLIVDGDLRVEGEILVEIDGLKSHDLLRVSGRTDLAGARFRFVLLGSEMPADLVGLSFLAASGGISGLESVSYAFAPALDGYRVTRNGAMLQLAAVPEPETWAMLLAGLGLVGMVARRRATAWR